MSNPNPVEDLGYAFVQRVVSESGAIWRRQAEKDIGVDGTIEVERRNGTHIYIAVQIKAGVSYFRSKQPGAITLDLKKQLQHLGKLALPTIVVVYNPDMNTGIWESVDQFLSHSPEIYNSGKIYIQRHQEFTRDTIDSFRYDLRTILGTPLEFETIDDFVRICASLPILGLIGVLQSYLNGFSLCTTFQGRETISFLKENALIEEIETHPRTGRIYCHTPKAEKLIRFLLGSHYPLPPKIFHDPNALTRTTHYSMQFLWQFLEPSLLRKLGRYDKISEKS
jgi:hypothetical protein